MYWQGKGKKRKELLMIEVWTRNLINKIKYIWRYFLDRLPVAEFDRLPVHDVSLKKIAKLPASVIFFCQIASIQIRQFDSSKEN